LISDKDLDSPKSPRASKLSNLSRLSNSEADGYLTIKECANLLKISEGSIRCFISNNLIRCHHKLNKGQYAVSKLEMISFSDRYFFLSDLSKMLGVSRIMVIKTLAKAGIMPTSGPLVDSGRVHIYAKSSIPPATIKSLTKKNNKTISRLSKEKKNEDSEFCVNVNSLCDRYSMTRPIFYKNFIANGFARSIERREIKEFGT